MSAESGLATFRGSDAALWERWRPEELATPEAFARDPATVWRWYRERRAAAASAQPNAGHRALATLERRRPQTVNVTQNVDGLLHRAGVRSVVEFHGNLFEDRCATEGIALESAEVDATGPLPRCRRCGALVRPGVVWFGEAIAELAIDAACQAAQRADGVIVVGTSANVAPANTLADLAAETGAWVLEINPASTAISDRVDHVLRAGAGDILPVLVAALAEEH